MPHYAKIRGTLPFTNRQQVNEVCATSVKERLGNEKLIGYYNPM